MPGARHSKHSKPGRSRGGRYGHRPVKTRTPLPVVVIVCDDKATAPAYFGLLKREVRQYVTVRVVPAPCEGASPDAVVAQAIREKATLADSPDDEARDAVWVLLDLEGDANRRQQTEAARKKAAQGGVKVALSIPCYEVWTLLHLEDIGQLFNSCGEVVSRVKRLWQQRFGEELGSKARADYSKIIPLRHEAARRAESHWNNNAPSRTEVFRVIQQIDACLDPPTTPP